MRNQVAILYSEAARRAAAEAPERRLYRFRGARGVRHWIRGEEAYLAPFGMAALLRRLAVRFDVVTEADCREGVLAAYRWIFVPSARALAAGARLALERWAGPGHRLIVTGRADLPEDLLGARGREPYRLQAYAALAPSPGSALPPAPLIPVAPPGYTVELRVARGGCVLGRLVEGAGSEEKGHELAGALLVATERALYCSAPICEYAGAALQWHIPSEALRPVLGPRFAIHLDEVAWLFGQILIAGGAGEILEVRTPPWGPHRLAVVLRHDTDFSRDTTYLEMERDRGVPATYAILPDRNRHFWLNACREVPGMEAAFHYRTNREGPGRRLLARAVPSWGIRPAPAALQRRGIFRQLQRAHRLRIPTATIHRHVKFFWYPEAIDAMAFACDGDPSLLGSNSFFRSQLSRYGGAGRGGDSVPYPPGEIGSFWFPFRPAMATLEEHRPLRLWEGTHALEPTPEELDALFAHAARFPDAVLTLGFHPGGTQNTVHNPKGNLDSFRYAVQRAGQANAWITTCQALYGRLTAWDALALRREEGRLQVWNGGVETVEEVVVAIQGSLLPLGAVAPGETRTVDL